MTGGNASLLALTTLGKAVIELGNTAIQTYRGTKELEVRYQAFRDALQHHRDVVESYLDHTFEERRFTLESYFKELHLAVENQDYQALTVLVGGILAVLQQNPLHDFEQFKAALADPDVTFEL